VSAARRALLHRRVAQALEEAPAGAAAEALAYHYARGGTSEKAARYLELAGDRAWAQRAHGAAESHYREAVDRLEACGRAQDAARVREKLGEVMYQTGRYEAAIRALEPAAEALRAAGDLEGLGHVAARIGFMHALHGTLHAGLALIQPLLGFLDRGAASPALAALYDALGRLLFAAGQYEASLVAHEHAAALAHASDDRTRLRAAYNRVNILQMLGRLADALRVGQEALPLAEAVGDSECLLAVLRDVAYIHAVRGAFAASREYSARTPLVARQLGDPGQLTHALGQHGWIAFLSGDWPAARAALDEAVALSRQVDRSWYSPYPLIFRARLCLAEGSWAAATVALQEAIALADEIGDLQALRWATGVVAELDVLEGRPEAARARLVPLLDRPGLEECDVTMLLPVLAWAHLELGQVDQATDALRQALARARREEMRLVLVEALRVQALVALRQGREPDAALSLEEGLALARGMRYPYAEARLLHVYGHLHTQKREPEAARERLQAALALFQHLGAGWDIQQTQQAITALQNAAPLDASLQPMAALAARHGGKAASPAGTRLARPDRHAWALDRLRADGALSPRAYARALGVSVDTALLDLRELVDRGLLRAEGTTKDRRYVLAGEERRDGDSPTRTRDSPNASRQSPTFGESM
jgi:tetratricopeptide (TPR) repeat protein